MANRELLSEIVSNEAFDQLDKLIKLLDASEKALIENAKAAITMNNALYGAKGLLAIQKAAASAEKAILNMIKAQKQLELTTARISAVNQKKAQDEVKHNRQIEDSDKRRAKQEEASIKRNEAARKRLEAQLKREQSEYGKLDRELTKVRSRAQDLAAQMLRLEMAGKKNTDEYARLEKRFSNLQAITGRLDGSIKKIDATLGKHQRNVGNYALGWSGLSNSINQVTRELPAFAISAQTGFLAISNNLPILADEIKRIRMENAALAAEGKKGIPVLRQIAMSFLSWQTALSLGITLLTLYGKDIVNWVGSLFKGKDAVDELRKSTENLNKAKLEGSKSAQSELATLDSYYRAATNANLPLSERKRAVDELQSQYPKYFKNLSDEEVMAGKAGAAYNRLAQSILAAAQARVYQDRIAENASKQLDNITSMVDMQAKFNEAQNRYVQLSERLSAMDPLGNALGYENIMAQTQAAEAARDAIGRQIQDMGEANGMLDRENQRYANQVQKLIASNGLDVLTGPGGGDGKKQEDLSKKRVEASLALQQFMLQTTVENNQRIMDSDLHSYQERLSALDNFVSGSEKLIEVEKQQALLGAELPEERAKIEEEAGQKIIDLRRAQGAALWQITQDNISRDDAARQSAAQRRLDAINASQSEELMALQDRFRKGLISQEQYEEDRKNIAHRYLMQYIAEEIRATEAIIALQKSRGQDTADAERRLAELKMKYSDEATRNYIENLEREGDEERKREELIREIREELFDLGTTLFEAEFERENQRLQAQLERLDEQEERERRAIESSALSQEEKAERTIGLEKRMDAERKRIEAQQRANQVRQARFEKAAAITKSAINTAVAITAVLPNFILAALVGALGAIQIATIAAKPIPQYYRGTDSSKEGLAHVGERGSELMVTPDGQLTLTPPTDTLAYLHKGTKIFTAHETKQILTKQTMPSVDGRKETKFDISPIVDAQKKSTAELKKALSKSQNKGTIITERGLLKVERSGSTLRNYIRRNKL